MRAFRSSPWDVGDGDRILILGEDEDGKTDDLKEILVPVDHRFSRVNGEHDTSMTALLLAPLPTDDDDDEEVLSKNNSSTILRFSLAGGGIGDKCRFLTGGDAEVAIWGEALESEFVAVRNVLSFDILLSPHHCSWHSLSYDSWSEMREEAEVAEDARNALSQARSGATIIASCNPIKDDDNDPPMYPREAGVRSDCRGRCREFRVRRGASIGEVPRRHGLRNRGSWVALGDRVDGSPRSAWGRADRAPAAFARVARAMARAGVGDAVRRALILIAEHPSVEAVGVPRIDEERGVVTVDVTFSVNLPSEWRRRGESPSGVRLREEVRLEFPGKFPLTTPQPSLRANFNRNLPHVQPWLADGRPVPCIYDGYLADLLHGEGLRRDSQSDRSVARSGRSRHR